MHKAESFSPCLVHFYADLSAPCVFILACSSFHASYSFLPSSFSKKACISGKKHLASVSSSCFGIFHLLAAIRQHGVYLFVGYSSFTFLFHSRRLGFAHLASFSSARVFVHGHISAWISHCPYLRSSQDKL